MSLLVALVVGAMIGGIGGYLLQQSFDSIVVNLLAGIAGAVLGGALYFFSDSAGQYFVFTWSGLFFSVAGAVIIIVTFSFFSRASPTRVNYDKVGKDPEQDKDGETDDSPDKVTNASD